MRRTRRCFREWCSGLKLTDAWHGSDRIHATVVVFAGLGSWVLQPTVSMLYLPCCSATALPASTLSLSVTVVLVLPGQHGCWPSAADDRGIRDPVAVMSRQWGRTAVHRATFRPRLCGPSFAVFAGQPLWVPFGAGAQGPCVLTARPCSRFGLCGGLLLPPSDGGSFNHVWVFLAPMFAHWICCELGAASHRID